MELFAIFLVNGIVLGSVYAVLAIGLTMIFSIMRIVNFAHGECFMIGAYIAWIIVTRLVPNYWLGFLLAVVVGGLLGYVIERLAFRRIYTGPHISQFIVSLGLVLVLQEAVFLNFTGLPQTMPTPYSTVRTIGKFSIIDQRLLVVGLTIILLVAIYLFFQRTKMGKSMRAAAGNKLAASMVGIKISWTSSLAFIAGTALAAVAGALLAPIFAINPFMGGRLIGIAFVIIVMGGMGSIAGAAIAGYTIGIVEGIFSGYVGTQWSFAVAFVILLLVLRFRPRGLFGRD